MGNPTTKELTQSVYSDTHQAASIISKAWTRGQFTASESHETMVLLRRALAAMTSLDSRIRGNPEPKTGD